MENTSLPSDLPCHNPSNEPQERRAPSALFAQNEVIETLVPIESPRWWTPIPPPPPPKKSTVFVRPKFETKTTPTPPPASSQSDPRKSDLQRLANQLVGEPEALTVKPLVKTKQLRPESRRTSKSGLSKSGVAKPEPKPAWKKYAAAALFALAAAIAMYHLPSSSNRANETAGARDAGNADAAPHASMDSRVRVKK